jgi:hypothetical protein
LGRFPTRQAAASGRTPEIFSTNRLRKAFVVPQLPRKLNAFYASSQISASRLIIADVNQGDEREMKKLDVILSSAFLFAAATGDVGSFAFGQGFGDYAAPTTRQAVPAPAPLAGQGTPKPQTRPIATSTQTPQTRPIAAPSQAPQTVQTPLPPQTAPRNAKQSLNNARLPWTQRSPLCAKRSRSSPPH